MCEKKSMDAFNPYFVLNKPHAAEILYILAYSDPYTMTQHDVEHFLSLEVRASKDVLESFERINTIERKDSKYKVNFQIYLKKDLPQLDSFSHNIAKRIGNKIVSLKPEIDNYLRHLTCVHLYGYERLYYHIIGDYIFDGTAFDFFEKSGLFCISKIQPGERDYILIGYDQSDEVTQKSSKLLCSSNNFISGNFRFNSFGDAQGLRKDLFRFFRILENPKVKPPWFERTYETFCKLNNSNLYEIANKSGNLLYKVYINRTLTDDLSGEDKLLFEFLRELQYVSLAKDSIINCSVPVFTKKDSEILNEISKIVLMSIQDDVKRTFNNLEDQFPSLTPIKHKIDIKEIANELWHQVFGFANEYLISEGFYQSPILDPNEGRYYQAFYIE